LIEIGFWKCHRIKINPASEGYAEDDGKYQHNSQQDNSMDSMGVCHAIHAAKPLKTQDDSTNNDHWCWVARWDSEDGIEALVDSRELYNKV